MENFQLGRLAACIEEFRHLSPDIQAQTMMTFLHVYKQEGHSIGVIQKKLGLSPAGASRNIAFLATVPKGKGLIEIREDLEDRRVRRIFLTPKGRSFGKLLEGLCNGNP